MRRTDVEVIVVAMEPEPDYAETDLDQPTDYSLRYAEDDTEEQEKPTSSYLQEDTIKTYCTEGTPYETPFTVSTATSMSDLRSKKNEEKPKENVEQTPLMFSRCSSLGSLSGCEQQSIHDDRSSVVSDFTSGMISPSELPDSPGQDLINKMRQVKITTPTEKKENSDEDDDDMLAACINVGMQNNRYRQSFDKGPDTVHVYCTEDTPADISPVGSQSNLSILSLSKSEQIDSSEDEKILDECIRSGIHKLPPINCRPFKRKSLGPVSSPVDSTQFSLSEEEEDIMLAQCIRSGMPKVCNKEGVVLLR